MNVRIPESSMQRMAVGVGAGATVLVVAGLIYLFVGGGPAATKFDGIKVVAAGHAYTRSLVAKKLPLPRAVSLNDLIAGGFLKPEDVGPFKGMDASLILTYERSSPDKVLMRVHMPDGSDFVLLGDGSAVEVPR